MLFSFWRCAVKQITVRDIGSELHKAIKKEAGRRGVSMNRYVLTILREAVGLDDGSRKPPGEYGDLDHLAGTWTDQDYADFIGQLEVQRGIDDDLWQ
jgi:hypothetical protein